MNGHTHIVGGLLVGALLAPILGQTGPHLAPFLVAAALAGPLPDVDHPGSMYGRFVPLPGVARVYGKLEPYVGGRFGNGQRSFGHVGRRVPGGIIWHRGPVHSAPMGLAFGALAGLIALHFAAAWVWTIGFGVLAGFLSHLALDELNVSGEYLLWPFVRKELRLKWPSWRVGSAWEVLVLVVMLAGIVGLLRPDVAHLALRAVGR